RASGTHAPAGSGGGLPSTGPRVAAGLSRAVPSGDDAAGGIDAGATGGSALPATTRSTSSRSSVSRSSSAAASRSSWSRCLVRMSLACSYASQQALQLGVHQLGGALGDLAALHHLAPQKDLG